MSKGIFGLRPCRRPPTRKFVIFMDFEHTWPSSAKYGCKYGRRHVPSYSLDETDPSAYTFFLRMPLICQINVIFVDFEGLEGHQCSIWVTLDWLLAGWMAAGWLAAGCWLAGCWVAGLGPQIQRPCQLEGKMLLPGWLQQPI